MASIHDNDATHQPAATTPQPYHFLNNGLTPAERKQPGVPSYGAAAPPSLPISYPRAHPNRHRSAWAQLLRPDRTPKAQGSQAGK